MIRRRRGSPVEFVFGVRRPDLVKAHSLVEAVVSDVVPDAHKLKAVMDGRKAAGPRT